jgi:GA4 desaturase
MLRGNHAKEQKWYWIRERRDDEVFVIQLFDSHAEKEGRPVGTPHVSSELLGVGEGDPRESGEARCSALWY